MNLPDPADLPNSTTAGPETWGAAFSKLATTTSNAQQLIENTNSDRTILESIYDRRIKTIADLTGQTLENPIHSLPGVPAFLQPRDRPLYGQYEDQFAKRVQTLSDQHPELGPQFQSLTSGVDDEMNRMRRDAEAAAGEASNDPALDPISGFAAKLAGGLAGAARDPFQWQMAVMGGGGSAGGTVASRIGKTMLQEGLLNGGQEAVLQAASQERKRAAGLEYGMKDALTNVGVAATFGALFGGSIEGGHALAKIYKMGDGGAEAAARVIDDAPQPGDVEMVAKAMNVDLHPDQVSMIGRSFEDKSLDETFFPDDVTPEHGRVVEAALRHAEDPDLHPPPEIVERAIADEKAGPAKFLTADDYERIYGGDPDAIDDLHGVMAGESLDDAARALDDQTRSPSAETVAPVVKSAAIAEADKIVVKPSLDAVTGDESVAVHLGDNPDASPAWMLANVRPDGVRIRHAQVAKDIRGLGHGTRMYQQLYDFAERRGLPLTSDAEVSAGAQRVYSSLQRQGYDVERNPAAKMDADGILVSPDSKPVFVVRGRPEAALADPLEGQTIRPADAAEPVDDAAMRSAEEQAGEISEPVFDENGNPQSLLDFIPVQDRDGNVRLMSTVQALEIADQGNHFADLLEACKL